LWDAFREDAQRQREQADYNDLAEFSQEEGESQLRDAKDFIDALRKFCRKLRESITRVGMVSADPYFTDSCRARYSRRR